MKYYVVVDLEMCRVGRQMRFWYPYKSEIIQIGAVLMDEQYNIIDRYNQMVRPEYGRVDVEITKLTGIHNADISHGMVFKDAIRDFQKWIPDGDITLVTWSENDERQFRKEAEAKGVDLGRLSDLFETAEDCQPLFAKRMDNDRLYRLEEALVASDINIDGRAHNGLVDAENTALLYRKLMLNPRFTLNTYYEAAHFSEETKGLSFSMGDLFSKCQLAIPA